MDRAEHIHQFWFQGVNDQTPIKNSQMPFKMWFMKDDKLDAQIRKDFEADLQAAVDGKRRDWESSAKGTLALVLLYDQFTRNMYRNSAAMFSSDERALSLTRQALDAKREEEFSLIERVFLFMPLQHSEDMRVQELSLEKFASLIERSRKINAANTPYYQYTFDYARRHSDIIKRFGRFPHRNKILGRVSTEEEEEFLKRPGSGF